MNATPDKSTLNHQSPNLKPWVAMPGEKLGPEHELDPEPLIL